MECNQHMSPEDASTIRRTAEQINEIEILSTFCSTIIKTLRLEEIIGCHVMTEKPQLSLCWK